MATQVSEIVIYRGKYFHIYDFDENEVDNDMDFKLGHELDVNDLVKIYGLSDDIAPSIQMLNCNTLNVLDCLIKDACSHNISQIALTDILTTFVSNTNDFYKLTIFENGTIKLEKLNSLSLRIKEGLMTYVLKNVYDKLVDYKQSLECSLIN